MNLDSARVGGWGGQCLWAEAREMCAFLKNGVLLSDPLGGGYVALARLLKNGGSVGNRTPFSNLSVKEF